MTTPLETVQTFYSAIAAGDTGKMVELMSSDIEWISVVDFHVQEKGPAEVMNEGLRSAHAGMGELLAVTNRVRRGGLDRRVSIGRFACVHRATHKASRSPLRTRLGCARREDLASSSVLGHEGA